VLSLSKALVALSALAFVLAVVTNFVGIFLTTSEGYSRASANLAILAIALVYCFRNGRPDMWDGPAGPAKSCHSKADK
jgi:hypothetical protein